MLNFSLCTEHDLTIVDSVVSEIRAVLGGESPTLLLVGAECRNLLHKALGHTTRLTTTTDLDIGIALDDWPAYLSLTEKLTALATSGTGIRYLIADTAVDLLPYGEVELPPGTVTPPTRGDAISVFGLREVADSATSLTLPCRGSILVPTVPGFVALKMQAWLDRSPSGEYKDAGDLAVACRWIADAQDASERAWSELGEDVMAALDYDQTLASVRLLSRDVAACLGEQTARQLAANWSSVDSQLLASNFTARGTRPVWPRERTLDVIAQLGAELDHRPGR